MPIAVGCALRSSADRTRALAPAGPSARRSLLVGYYVYVDQGGPASARTIARLAHGTARDGSTSSSEQALNEAHSHPAHTTNQPTLVR